MNDQERFETKYVRGGDDECWLWLAGQRKGYGEFSLAGRNIDAHVAALIFATGEQIAPKTVVMHSCDTKLCVNPRHLSVGSKRDNAPNTHKTHCPSGHEYTEANTWVDKKGARFCRECHRIRQANRRAR